MPTLSEAVLCMKGDASLPFSVNTYKNVRRFTRECELCKQTKYGYWFAGPNDDDAQRLHKNKGHGSYTCITLCMECYFMPRVVDAPAGPRRSERLAAKSRKFYYEAPPGLDTQLTERLRATKERYNKLFNKYHASK
jgi:hypothetical protein